MGHTWRQWNSPNQSARFIERPTLVVVHCTQGSTAAGAASWLMRPSTRASAHVVIDDREGYRLVPDSRKAWHVKNANDRSLGLEIVGFVQWTRAQWLSHMPTLRESARVHAAWNRKYGIPLTESIQRGYHSHDGMPGNDHSDPGPNFPWDVYLGLVKSASKVQSPPQYPYGTSLRIRWTPEGGTLKAANGNADDWGSALHVMRWFAKKGIPSTTKIVFTWRGTVRRYTPGVDPITDRNAIILVMRTLLNRYDGGWR